MESLELFDKLVESKDLKKIYKLRQIADMASAVLESEFDLSLLDKSKLRHEVMVEDNFDIEI